MSIGATVIARAESERGELVLRRRADGEGLELRVNGIFVMDDQETSTEAMLAQTTLDVLAAGAGSAPTAGAASWRVVVGGLGLGFTLTEVLADPRVDSALLVEIEPELVAWHRAGLVPGSPLVEAGPEQDPAVGADPRLRVEIGDVREVVTALPSRSVDLVLLDVDNGPDFLVYDENAAVYEHAFLAQCRRVLSPYGTVAIWSADSSAALTTALDGTFGSSRELAVPVTLQSRDTTYHLFLAPR